MGRVLDELDGIPIFHSIPHPVILKACRDRGRQAWMFVHGLSWWCPSGTRWFARREEVCGIQAGTVACTLRYHAMGCGGLRVRSLLEGLRRVSAGRSALAAADRVLVASNYMRREAVHYGAPEARTHRVHLPSPFLHDERPVPGDAETPPVILFAGRITPVKGVALLVRAFARMKQDARLILAGTGIADRTVASMVRRHPRSQRIEMTGHLGDSDVRRLMSRASVVVVPSLWPEPFGLVGIEALSMGRPVVTFAVGGIADWALPDLGVFGVSRPEAALLAEGLDTVLREPVWRERAMHMGSPWVARHHAHQAHMQELHDIVSAATGHPRAPRAAP